MSNETINPCKIRNEDRQSALKSRTNCLRGLQTDDTVRRVRRYFAESSFLNTSNERPLYLAWQTSHKERETKCSTAHLWKLVANATQSVKFANGSRIQITAAVVPLHLISFTAVSWSKAVRYCTKIKSWC